MSPFRGFLVSLILLASPGYGCLHFGKKFVGKVDQGTEQAFLFHDGALAHLIIKTDLHAKGGKLPKEVSWVLPFPAIPKSYAEADNKILEELTGFVSPEAQSWGSKGGPTVRSNGKSIRVHEPKEVGQYKIQEIEMLDDKGGKELNAWLAEHQYNPMPLDLQKPYLKKGAVFLAITVKLDEKDATFKPLHVAYPAKELSLPLKFTHDNRVLDVNLFVFTSKPLDDSASRKPYWNFVAKEVYEPGTAKVYPALGKELGVRTGFLTRFEGRKLNTAGRKLRELSADPTFTP